jgi:hypothetical protein
MPRTIEEIILAGDRRGIAALAPSLPRDYCTQAARFVLEHPGPALITTGFYILSAAAAETDGPPGAIALGNALQALGFEVDYVTDGYAAPLLEPEAGNAPVHLFPIADAADSRAYAAKLLAEVQPALLIAIERCGRCRDGSYRNMRGLDISAQTARIDELFLHHPATVGIGDGGNEIGMGSRYDEVQAAPSLVREPCAVPVDRLVIAAVSNWGGYGLVAALSRLTDRQLLPTPEEHRRLILAMVERGAVDGVTGLRPGTVDGLSLEANLEVLAELREVALRRQPPAGEQGSS